MPNQQQHLQNPVGAGGDGSNVHQQPCNSIATSKKNSNDGYYMDEINRTHTHTSYLIAKQFEHIKNHTYVWHVPKPGRKAIP